MNKNKLVVIARLDHVGNQILSDMKQIAHSLQHRLYANSSDWPPHVTIAAYEGMDEKELCNYTSEFAATHSAFDITFQELRIFPRAVGLETEVIYASPAPSATLSAFHRKFHARYDEYCGDYGWQSAKADYTFHSTITICHTDDTCVIMDELRRQFVPFTAYITALEIYRNPCQFVSRFELKRKSEKTDPSSVPLPIIYEVEQNELQECLDVIHQSFQTVADQFGLTKENCPKHTSFIPLSFLETQKNWGWQMYALYVSKKIIGYMSLSKESDDAFELHNLAVLPEYRHNGFGKLLLDHAKDVVKASGGNVIKIGIIEESTVLKNWYIANGFVHTGTKKFDHLPFTSGYLEWIGG